MRSPDPQIHERKGLGRVVQILRGSNNKIEGKLTREGRVRRRDRNQDSLRGQIKEGTVELIKECRGEAKENELRQLS